MWCATSTSPNRFVIWRRDSWPIAKTQQVKTWRSCSSLQIFWIIVWTWIRRGGILRSRRWSTPLSQHHHKSRNLTNSMFMAIVFWYLRDGLLMLFNSMDLILVTLLDLLHLCLASSISTTLWIIRNLVLQAAHLMKRQALLCIHVPREDLIIFRYRPLERCKEREGHKSVCRVQSRDPWV